MTRRASLLVAIALLTLSVPTVAVTSPAIEGTISGIELCPQFICEEAFFAGSFAGTINGKRAPGVFWTGITHEDLPTTIEETANITGGTWTIRTPKKVFSGVVPAGTLTYQGDNTYSVVLTMEIKTGGHGTLTFAGVLDHNNFPPTIDGAVLQ